MNYDGIIIGIRDLAKIGKELIELKVEQEGKFGSVLDDILTSFEKTLDEYQALIDAYLTNG